MYTRIGKPFLDITAALIGLVLISPVFIVVTILLTIVNKGQPFFVQVRPGKHEKLFKLIKFKTMTSARDAKGTLLSDAERLTKMGTIVRKTSLDELPQLINVLKGDMSLIGPRPLLPEYLPLYNTVQKQRHNVKPGITGWAQVNGRNAISWQKKFEYDVWYVKHLSFSLDLKILFKTVLKVLKSEGINTQHQATTLKFTGNE